MNGIELEQERKRGDRLHLALKAARFVIGDLVERHNAGQRRVTVSIHTFDKVISETARAPLPSPPAA